MAVSVVNELQATLKIEPEQGETALGYAERLARAANRLSNDDWGTLDSSTQRWINTALEAITKKRKIPIPKGLEALFTEPAKGDSKETRVAKAEAKKAKREARLGATRSKFSRMDEIIVDTDINPYRKGTQSEAWFNVYRTGMTVAEAQEAGVPRHHIRWDFKRGNIKIGTPEKE